MNFVFQYEFDMADNGSETWDIDVEFSETVDSNYGADADGNRGMEMRYTDLKKFTIFGPGGKDITKTVMDTWQGDYVAIEKEVQKYIDGGGLS